MIRNDGWIDMPFLWQKMRKTSSLDLVCQLNEHVINQHHTGKTSMTFEFPTASQMFSLRSHHRLCICDGISGIAFVSLCVYRVSRAKMPLLQRKCKFIRCTTYTFTHSHRIASIGIIEVCVCVKCVQSTLDRIMFLVVLYRLNYEN